MVKNRFRMSISLYKLTGNKRQEAAQFLSFQFGSVTERFYNACQ